MTGPLAQYPVRCVVVVVVVAGGVVTVVSRVVVVSASFDAQETRAMASTENAEVRMISFFIVSRFFEDNSSQVAPPDV